MSFLAGAAVSTLDLDTNPFSQGFLQAQTTMSLFPSIVTSFMANPILGLVDLTKQSFGAITGIIKSAFEDSFESADKIHDMAENVGVAVETLSGLGLAASQAGSGLESMADAFKFLGKNQADVIDGDNVTGKVFEDLGVQLTDTAGKARPLEEVMFEVSDAIAAIESPGKRTQVAMALLGRSGTDLLATLSQGSAALKGQIAAFDEYGAVVHKTAADSADEFGDLKGEIEIAWKGIQNQLGEPLRESLTPILKNLIDWIRSNQGEIRSTVATIVSAVVSGIEIVVTAVERLKSVLAGAAIGAAAGGVIGSFIPVIGTAIGAAAGAAIGGTAGYNVGGSSQQRTTLNVYPIDASASTGQLMSAWQAGLRQQKDEQRLDQDRAARRFAVENGL